MQIRYTNTFRDILAFCLYHYARSPIVLASYAFGGALLSLTIVQAVQSLPGNTPLYVKAFAFLFVEFLALTLVGALYAALLVLSMVSRRNKTVLTDHRFALAPESFVDETAYSKTEFKWSAVQKLARTRRYIFVYVAQHAAHVIPKRAFQDDAEWNAFYQFCRERTSKV
jgi:hypothetical protein